MNPRAAINDLHPFQGCPFSLLGTSAKSRLTHNTLIILKPLKKVVLKSGEDGIRTHAPVKTNGFQDRPVMTASVPLHIYSSPTVPVQQQVLFYQNQISMSTVNFIFSELSEYYLQFLYLQE